MTRTKELNHMEKKNKVEANLIPNKIQNSIAVTVTE